MRVLLYHGLFEKLPTSDKLPAIIFSASLIISWKVKWLREYPVVGHCKFLMDGPSTHFWSFLSKPSDTFFYLFVHAGFAPRQTCCYGQHSQQWRIPPHAWSQPLVTVSLSDMTDKSKKQNLWEKIWNQVPALSLSLCKDDLMFSECCVVNLTWSWDRGSFTKRVGIFLTCRPG